MRGARGMDCQRAGITDVGDVVEHLERIDEACTRLSSFFQLETYEAAEATGEIGAGAAPLLSVFVHAGVNNPRDSGMPMQMQCDLGRVAAMLAHAESQGLQ